MNQQNMTEAGTGAVPAGSLGASGLVQLEHFPAPADLQPYVTTLILLRCEGEQFRDTLPAAVGYLSVMLHGAGALHFADGRIVQSYPETLLAPTNAAVGLEGTDGLVLFAAALSPLGWAALTGLDAGRHRDRADDATALLGSAMHEVGEQMRLDWARGIASGPALAAELGGFIAPLLRPLNPRHVKLVMTVSDWLSASIDPKLVDLERNASYSPRQLERLVVRYFGCGPKLLARKYRALRVLALLQSPETGPERAAELLNLFYDQSHMIREVRHFAGLTPGDYLEAEGSLVSEASGLRNYREFRPNIARIPGD
jgi:AraC-like DNA-binding protein